MPMEQHPAWKVLDEKHRQLTSHPLYGRLNKIDHLKIFMESHVFAVWDFMSLLKSLQRGLTCVEVPWTPSPYPGKIVRLINEIVLVEESDEGAAGDESGNCNNCYSDHFSLYLKAMEEVGACRDPILQYLKERDDKLLFPEVAQFIQFTLQLASRGSMEEVAASFFFGREKLIPDMFASIVEVIKSPCPSLDYYLKRHIEVDQNHHGPMILECLNLLCQEDEVKWQKAFAAAFRSLDLRYELWNGVYQRVIGSKGSNPIN